MSLCNFKGKKLFNFNFVGSMWIIGLWQLLVSPQHHKKLSNLSCQRKCWAIESEKTSMPAHSTLWTWMASMKLTWLAKMLRSFVSEPLHHRIGTSRKQISLSQNIWTILNRFFESSFSFQCHRSLFSSYRPPSMSSCYLPLHIGLYVSLTLIKKRFGFIFHESCWINKAARNGYLNALVSAGICNKTSHHSF